MPTRTLSFEVNDGVSSKIISWKVTNDMYNNRYLYCPETNSKAFFVNDDTLHYFTLFEGKRNSLLYYFFIGAYKVLLGYYNNLSVKEQYPLHLLAPTGLRYLHDFTAPFFQYMSAQYNLEYVAIDDELSPDKVELHSSATLKRMNKIVNQIDFKLIIKGSRFVTFEIKTDNKIITAKCTE